MHEHHDHLPEDLERVARRLREERLERSPLELDHIKRRVLVRASGRKGILMLKRRLLTAALTLALVGGGTGAVVMANHGGSHGGGGGGGAPQSQYCPKNGKPKEKGPPGNKCGQPNPGQP